jgi:hypothetical protein
VHLVSSLGQAENTGESKVRESVLSSIPSETKHDRRMAPRTKLFLSKRRLQKQRPEPRKNVLGSSLGEEFGFTDNFSFIFNDT